MNFIKKLFVAVSFILVPSVTFCPIIPWLNQSFKVSGKQQLPKLFESNDKKRMVKAIIAKKPVVQIPTIMSDVEWNELEGDYFIELMDRTQTAFGQWGLRRLTTPITNRQLLKERQKRLQLLTSDLVLLQQLKKQLQLFAQHEDSLIAYYNPNDQLNKNAHRLYYSIFKKQLNSSITALEGAYCVDIGTVVATLAGTLCLNGIWQHNFSSLLKGNPSFTPRSMLQGMVQGLREPFSAHNWNFEQLKNNPQLRELCAANGQEWLATFLVGSGGDQWAIVSDYLKNYCPSETVAQVASAFAVGTKVILNDIGRWLTLKSSAQELWFLFNTANQLQDRLSHVSKLFQIAQDITLLGQDHPEIASWPEFEIIKNHSYASAELSNELKELIELLSAQTFCKEGSYVYSRGKVLVAQKLLTAAADDLIILLLAFAEFDAQLSVATVVQQLRQEGKTFAWPQFSDEQEPFISFSDAWNPLIHNKKAVLNNIEFGGQKAQKAIITGPNGGGKSSTMKTMAWSVILAQSWAVAPCSGANLSLFGHIKTSLQPHESIKEGLSSFMAEKKRMREIESVLQTRGNVGAQLILIDEPYHGTVEFEASKRVYDFCYSVMDVPCLLMIATHLQKPIMLEADTQGKFVNFQMDYTEDDLGNITRSFKFIPGPAFWWFNDSVKRLRFIESLEFN